MAKTDHMGKLGNLFQETGHDWCLEVHHILTEPTCPSVCISPEGSNIARYMVHADSIEAGIEIACSRVYREVIKRERVGHSAPITNAHDKIYLEWLEARWAGSDAELPEFLEDSD